MSIRITSFASLLRKQATEMPKQARKGLRQGIRRGKALLVRRTPVYLGEMRNSYQDSDTRIRNDAPHAGVVERGARPHGVSAEGRAEIEQWFMRQRGLDEKRAKAAAWGYIQKLKVEGQEGEFIVEKALDELRGLAQQEIERLIFQGVKQ